jgi:hypothetical protein
MSYLGSWKLEDSLTFVVNTHSTAGAETDADAAPSYRVYEDETTTPLLTGTMALLDDGNTVGQYSEQITLSAGSGFEKGKCYTIRVRAVVGGVAGSAVHTFQIEAEVDANTVSGTPPDSSGVATLLLRLTNDRAALLDKLNITGNVAGSAEVVAIQNNTRVVRVVPNLVERPDSGSTAFRIELYCYDETGSMEAPDSAPTLSVVNQSGTSRDGNLDSTSMTLVSTGRYRSTYTVDSAHAIEELVFVFSLVEGGATRLFGNVSQVVDTTAVDFTSADRTKLEAIHSAATEARLAELDSGNLPADIATVGANAATAATQATAAASSAASADTKATTLLNRLGAWTGSGINTVLGAFRALAAKANGLTPSDLSAGTTFDNTTDSGEAIRDQGDAEWLTGEGEGGETIGAHTVTITVTDEDTLDPIFGALVSVKTVAGSLVEQGRTDADGEFSTSLDDGSYTASVNALAGYSGVADQAFTVNGDEDVSVALAPIPVASVSPGTRVVRIILVGANGAALSGVVVTAQLAQQKATLDQALIQAQRLSATTNGSGVADLVCVTADEFEDGAGEYVFCVPNWGSVRTGIPAGAGVLNLQEHLQEV